MDQSNLTLPNDKLSGVFCQVLGNDRIYHCAEAPILSKTASEIRCSWPDDYGPETQRCRLWASVTKVVALETYTPDADRTIAATKPVAPARPRARLRTKRREKPRERQTDKNSRRSNIHKTINSFQTIIALILYHSADKCNPLKRGGWRVFVYFRKYHLNLNTVIR